MMILLYKTFPYIRLSVYTRVHVHSIHKLAEDFLQRKTQRSFLTKTSSGFHGTMSQLFREKIMGVVINDRSSFLQGRKVDNSLANFL